MIGGFTLRASVVGSPTTSWKLATTSTWTGAVSWEGADVRVWVYNYMTLNGIPSPVRLDHVRTLHS